MGINLFRKIVFMFPVFGFDEGTWEGHFPLALADDDARLKRLNLPPFLFINAEYDVDLHEHTQDMVACLARAGVHTETFTVRGYRSHRIIHCAGVSFTQKLSCRGSVHTKTVTQKTFTVPGYRSRETFNVPGYRFVLASFLLFQHVPLLLFAVGRSPGVFAYHR